MPFTAAELSYLGNVSLDHYTRRKPVDQVQVERPFLAALMRGKRDFPGGKQFVVETLRYQYDSNFQHYFGSQAVTYKKKETIKQANWAWGNAFDGFFLDEDTLFANAITINDQQPKSATNSEMEQLVDLLEENNQTLREGFEEQLNLSVAQDGTQDTEAVAGLDHIISTTPTTGTVGGLDASVETWWRNAATLDVAAANVISTMETNWRACIKNGGRPDLIIAGTEFVDTFRNQAASTISRYTIVSTDGQPVQFDPSVRQSGMGTGTGLHFQGVPILWDPTFADLDALLSPTKPFERRCYFINTRHLKLRPGRGHDMISRKPPREYNRMVWYWALTLKYSITSNRRHAHSVIHTTTA